VVRGAAELQRGRESYAGRKWIDAYESLAVADRASPLGAEDLELLARSAYMLGRDDDYLRGLERAHGRHLESGEVLPAVRCAWWIGHNLLFRGATAPARGWFARAQRLLERERGDCVEAGYLLIPVLLEHALGGDHLAAYATAVEITETGARFSDRDLEALGLMEQGHALVRQGHTEDGLRLVDETMVAVTAGELSPIVAGIVYCNTIAFCQGVYELRRARDWTSALTRWCAEQPDMVAHNGLCLVHRAQLMTLAGAWPDALAELDRLRARFTEGVLNQRALGHAAYCEGELHRLRGRLAAAEDAYRTASRLGREPQPGLSLLRLAQGSGETAAAAIRRAVGETRQPLERAALLPAYIEVTLATGDVDAALSACRELNEIAERQGAELLHAMAAQARGEVALAQGDPDSALIALRRAGRAWQQLDAPHEAARARALVGMACRSLGDEDTAALELEAARGVLTDLGATPAIAWVDALAGRAPADDHGLTERELEVLRLVAAGRTNREIAAALVISERTVARHLENIFAKLRVSSRTAAAAFAFEHHLV
jgi:ATP/maltotriose-dependent transcriptional regulator MalT